MRRASGGSWLTSTRFYDKWSTSTVGGSHTIPRIRVQRSAHLAIKPRRESWRKKAVRVDAAEEEDVVSSFKYFCIDKSQTVAYTGSCTKDALLPSCVQPRACGEASGVKCA